MSEKNCKKKLAFVIDQYRKGGVVVVLEVLLKLLVEQGEYDITLFIRDFDKKTMYPLPAGIECYPWEAFDTISEAFQRGGISTVGTLLCNKIISGLSIRNYGRKTIYKARCRKPFPGKYDCVIAYHMIPNDVAVVALEKICAERKILWVHFRKNIAAKEKRVYGQLYALADAIVCVSEGICDILLNHLPELADKTLAIHNVYDIPHILGQSRKEPENMNQGHESAILVTVARLAREKGYDRVVAAAKRLADEGYDFHWYIVGDGAKREEIEQDILEKKVANRVHLLGHRNNPYPYIQHCDIYVQPSYMEGFCTSTMEAKILHKPVVTTDVPGMREQFADGENGLIVESSVDGIYTGIRKLLDDSNLMEKIKENLRSEPVSNAEALRQTMEVINGTQA